MRARAVQSEFPLWARADLGGHAAALCRLCGSFRLLPGPFPAERDETARPRAEWETSTLPPLRPTYQVTELLGDGIGPELSRAIHRLADALPIRLDFVQVDFRLENRRARGKAIYDEAVETITATRVALKHPTTTAEESPNAILRRRLDLSVIHRPVYTIPGVPTNFRRELDLDIVRIATGGTYDDPGRMIGEDGAVSLRIVERRPVREAARYAFNLARKTGKQVTSSSKYTIQKATDGLFEQVDPGGRRPVPRGAALGRALRRAPGQGHHGAREVSDRAGLERVRRFPLGHGLRPGRLAGHRCQRQPGFDPAAVVRVALFDAAHGTAPDIAGKNLANPTAIFLALSLLLYQLGEIAIGQAVKNATLDLLRQGVRTRDLGGQESTDSFTEAVAAEVARRMASATTEPAVNPAPEAVPSPREHRIHHAAQISDVHRRADGAGRRWSRVELALFQDVSG